MHSALTLKNIAISCFIFAFILTSSAIGTPVYFPAYVLPTYPPSLNRAVVQGSFVVEVSGCNGRIGEVKVISHNTFLPSGKRLDKAPPMMVRGIINALKKWEYDQRDIDAPISFQIVIEFRLADEQQASSKASRCRYEINEMNGIPTKIVIEEDRIRSKELYE